jgi:predicted DNA-binding transcriptional regulator AlpA
MAINRDDSWLTGVQVNQRYSISAMTRYRWERDQNLGFPAPMKVNRRSFWPLSELLRWEQSRTPA